LDEFLKAGYKPRVPQERGLRSLAGVAAQGCCPE